MSTKIWNPDMEFFDMPMGIARSVADGAREFMAVLIRLSCLPALVRWVQARNKVTIVLYHDPAPEIFEKHLAYLSRRYNFIALSDLVGAIRTGDWRAIRPYSIVLTFDDGHVGNYRLLPLIKKYGVRPTIYLCSGISDTNRKFWFKALKDPKLIQTLKECPADIKQKIMQDHCGFSAQREYPESERQALNKLELHKMMESCDFGSHSQFHPTLTILSNQDCTREIADSKGELFTMLNRECEHFAFPNGDYAERELAIVKDAGYLSARTIDAGWNDMDTDPYRLRITGVSDTASVNMLMVQLSGISMFVRYALKRCFDGRSPKIARGINPPVIPSRQSDRETF